MQRWRNAGIALTLVAVAACSSDDSSDSDDSSAAETGGAGGTDASTWGTGGVASGATSSGGVPPSGGSAGSGGVPVGPTGGAFVPSGGAQTSGGSTTTGGDAPTGGTSAGGGTATGGATTTGGTATGGATTTGGTATGGATTTGGTATGGVTETGGATSTGGGETGGAATGTSTCNLPSGSELANASLPPGFCAWTWADNVGSPRGATVNAAGDLIVVARSQNAVLLLHDDDEDGVSGDGERAQLASATGLNHGVAIHGGYLYASSDTTVYRWPYDGGREPLSGQQTVITGLPSGGHSTRTLVFDDTGYLYVSVGSASNVDSSSDRSRVVRFSPEQLEAGSSFAAAEVWADGTRNEVGLRFDARGRLWGVENGSDNLNHPGMGDIHNDNPGEEVNLFDQPGAFYGYPVCWSEGALPSEFAQGPSTQWAYPSSSQDDAWCRNPDNVVPSAMVMQAHSAPLDIMFYPGGSFPAEYTGDALVSFHGSWNRSPETGYKVVRLPFGDDNMPNGTVEPLLEYSGSGDTGSGWPHRPVGLATMPDGKVLVTSDVSGIVIAIGYDGS